MGGAGGRKGAEGLPEILQSCQRVCVCVWYTRSLARSLARSHFKHLLGIEKRLLGYNVSGEYICRILY